MSVERTFVCQSHPCSGEREGMEPCSFTVHDAEWVVPPDTCPWGYGKPEGCTFEEKE